MGARSDSRERMVSTAAELLRRRGRRATSWRQVTEGALVVARAQRSTTPVTVAAAEVERLVRAEIP